MLPKIAATKRVFLLTLVGCFIGAFLIQARPALGQTPQTNLGQMEEVLRSPDMSRAKWLGGDLEVGGSTPGLLHETLASIIFQIEGVPGATPSASALNSLNTLIAGMYGSPPASSIDYFADLGNNLGIVKPAYAQGVGFTGLSPILGAWKAFRNIAYFFFVIIFIFVGFAIMFRVKLDPQTVVTIQSALPRIVVALILVTFSYAIAGLLIDLMYVLIFLLIAFFKQANMYSFASENIQEAILQPSIFALIQNIFNIQNIRLAAVVEQMVEGLLGYGGLADFMAKITSLLAQAIFAIALIFVIFKLFFTLLISYVSVILATIFSPFLLMFEAIPGQRGLVTWLRMMAANLLVFPTVVAVLVIVQYIGNRPGGDVGWVAPFVGVTTDTAQHLVALGMILLLPNIVDAVKKAVGAPGGMAAGVMAPITGAAGVAAAPFKAAYGYTFAPMFEEARKMRGQRMTKALPKWMGGP